MLKICTVWKRKVLKKSCLIFLKEDINVLPSKRKVLLSTVLKAMFSLPGEYCTIWRQWSPKITTGLKQVNSELHGKTDSRVVVRALVRWEDSRITTTLVKTNLLAKGRKGKSFHAAHNGSEVCECVWRVCLFMAPETASDKSSPKCASRSVRGFGCAAFGACIPNSVALRSPYQLHCLLQLRHAQSDKNYHSHLLSLCWLKLLPIYLIRLSCTAAAALSTDTKCKTLRLSLLLHFSATDFHFTFSDH